MENQHQKIIGYRDLSENELAAMNTGKELAKQVGEWIEHLEGAHHLLDQRAVALAKTNLQQGFMWATRAIGQPTTF